MDTLKGEHLIKELLAAPAKFNEQGTAYQLLQEYVHGLPLDTLHPLLTHHDQLVQRAAIFVLSELGRGGAALICDVLPFLETDDRYMKYHALEILMVCSFAEHVEKFIHVVRALEDDDPVIRTLAMDLVSNADTPRLEAAIRLCEAPGSSDAVYKEGLVQMIQSERLTPEDVLAMLQSEYALVRKYGVIIAERLLRIYPDLIVEAAASISDADVHEFSKEVIVRESCRRLARKKTAELRQRRAQRRS